MKLRSIFPIILCVVGYFFVVPFAHADTISQFEANIAIQKTGELNVQENILYDFGFSQKHGIYRTIPYLRTNTDGKKYILDFSKFSVTNGSTPYNFTVTDINETNTVKIGDSGITVTGTHPYNITYIVKGALTYFSDHDELYWNVTGNGWDYPINEVTATIILPEKLNTNDVKLACFTGTISDKTRDCTVVYAKGIATINTKKPLLANEGMTIVVGFPKDIVAVMEPRLYVSPWDTQSGKIFIGICILIGVWWYLLLPISIAINWWRKGRDPKPVIGVASAWFDPPKTTSGRKLTPGETGTLVDEIAQMRDIMATIIHLAQRGYLKIIEVKKEEFQLKKLTNSIKTDLLQPFEEKLFNGIFENKDFVSLKTTALATTVETTKNTLYNAVVSEGFFLSNPQSTRNSYIALAVIGLFTGNILLFLFALIFGLQMPRKTKLGSDQAAVARSLENFLSSQERQLEFQAKNQMFFEKLLPYAIAFGVEDVWAKRFSNINMTQPDWYQGNSTSQFNSIMFVNSLSHTNSSFTQAATPVSSSTGHSSGFSSGFSGGGGGGGGSW